MIHSTTSNAKENITKGCRKRHQFITDDGDGTHPLKYGYVSILGRKREMEDPVMVVPPRKLPGGYSFLAAYGGLGRAKAGETCTDKLHRCLEKHTAETREEELDWGKVMMECFGSMFEKAEPESQSTMKFTAVVVGVEKGEVVLVNCGGSRAVVWSGGVASTLWNDHKADENVEAEEGAMIRRNHGLVLPSRSQGERSDLEVTVTRRNGKSEDFFVIIASDGLWNVVGKEMACEVVRKCICGDMKRLACEDGFASQAAALLAELAIARGSKDNISIIVAQLN